MPDTRSTVGTATDANAMLRILFSRLGQLHIGSPNAFSIEPPGPGEARVRFATANQQVAETWMSVHEGAKYLGMASSQGIRDPQAHKTANQLTEQEALGAARNP